MNANCFFQIITMTHDCQQWRNRFLFLAAEMLPRVFMQWFPQLPGWDAVSIFLSVTRPATQTPPPHTHILTLSLIQHPGWVVCFYHLSFLLHKKLILNHSLVYFQITLNNVTNLNQRMLKIWLVQNSSLCWLYK